MVGLQNRWPGESFFPGESPCSMHGLPVAQFGATKATGTKLIAWLAAVCSAAATTGVDLFSALFYVRSSLLQLYWPGRATHLLTRGYNDTILFICNILRKLVSTSYVLIVNGGK